MSEDLEWFAWAILLAVIALCFLVHRCKELLQASTTLAQIHREQLEAIEVKLAHLNDKSQMAFNLLETAEDE